MNLLEIDRVVKRYQTKLAVDDISLVVPQGVVLGLLGPNGAGKTTLIRMLTRITFPDSGHIRFLGEPLAEKHQAQTGYMPEERGLYKKMKVREHLVYLLTLKDFSPAKAGQMADHWLGRMGLADWAHRKVDELSKGMQQKVQFIQTVAHNPPLLILDEPFSGLDPLNAQLIENTIRELAAQGTTILFSTHRMEQVEQFCEHIALVHNGKLVLNGPIADIRRRYRKSLYRIHTAEPLGTLTLPVGTHEESRSRNEATFRLPDGTGPQALVEALNRQVTLERFELVLPSLRDIFIETVGAENLTAEQAQPALV
ncbi:MAG: ATP-binding cassette domain-containing protein [Bacteroidia bacterium]|nr:ATP-binding cassette domain-containing protein [Bacteroidia bacterium]